MFRGGRGRVHLRMNGPLEKEVKKHVVRIISHGGYGSRARLVDGVGNEEG